MAKRTLAHRIQYVEWNPTAISSIAVSPDNKYLACGRNNGRVEIWNIDNDFHMERVIPGREGTMISCLQWYQPPLSDGADVAVKGLESNHVEEEARLFASGLHGENLRDWPKSSSVKTCHRLIRWCSLGIRRRQRKDDFMLRVMMAVYANST